jgi:ribosomal protein S18 acetylase RimI-like enzyme
MEVRFARGEDIPGIIKLLQQVGRVHHEGRPDLFRVNAQKYSPSQVLDMLGKMPIFVAVENGVVLGYGFCMFEQFHDNSVMTDRTTLYIDDICVLEECRGQHIGTAIYNEIISGSITIYK